MTSKMHSHLSSLPTPEANRSKQELFSKLNFQFRVKWKPLGVQSIFSSAKLLVIFFSTMCLTIECMPFAKFLQIVWVRLNALSIRIRHRVAHDDRYCSFFLFVGVEKMANSWFAFCELNLLKDHLNNSVWTDGTLVNYVFRPCCTSMLAPTNGLLVDFWNTILMFREMLNEFNELRTVASGSTKTFVVLSPKLQFRMFPTSLAMRLN